MNQNLVLPAEARDGRKDIAVAIIFSILTCGIYNIYWNYCMMKTLNGLLGRSEFSFGMWLVLSILTCGIFHMYYEYRMGLAIQEIQKRYGLEVDSNLGLISLVLSVFGLTVVADAIQQHHLNKLYVPTA